MSQPTRITGIGSALVDILIHESDAFLTSFNKEKGGMTLEDNQTIETILAKAGQKPAIVSGGAACNTIVGIGKLGGEARFIGRRGDDAYGRLFEDALAACNV
ncbi:MAG: PfkB family carbohydrate kinase, partial [Desulfovibrionales bacterium]|nr:PfkB family carbohydrate kinase [Desulfovibrionales bacterium]